MATTEITQRSALDLADAIRRRELTSSEVVSAHIALLTEFASPTNAIVADRYERARAEAREVDQRIAQAALRGPIDELPPLLGVPFTVKESIAVEGMPNSAGVVARAQYRAPQSATVVRRLTDAGAIPLGVTNTSELTLWIESNNRLYGRTNNPYDPSRTAGGSSGGEGAAVGCGGSPFGIGADIGGSIRIPALFCGVFGHKPSRGLVPNTGLWPPSTGDSGRLLATGPLTRRAEDLMPILRIIAGPDGKDSETARMVLGEPATVSLDGLQVTTIEDTSRRAMPRALRDARERGVGALVAAGAVVRHVRMPSWRTAALPYLATLQAAAAGGSGGATASLLADSGEGTSIRSLLRDPRRHTLPMWLTLAAEQIPTGKANRDRLLQAARDLATELSEAIGDGVLLHPAYPGTAPRHGRTIARPWLMTSAAVFNLAGVPVTEVPLGLTDGGLPVGVQVAAAHGADHRSIAIALELEAVLGGWVPPPRPA